MFHKIKTKDSLYFQGHNPWMENHQEVNPLTARTYPAFFLSLYNLKSTCIFSTLLLNISYGTNNDNSFENQELLQLMIIFPILMTLLFHSEVLLYGEIISQLLLRVKGLQRKNPFP